jgi:predicted nucleic acid-binding protein
MSDDLRISAGRPVVIDSSVAFKWFDATEAGADVAGHLLDAHGRDEIALVAPAHLPIEIVNAFACRGGTLERTLGVIEDLTAVDLLLAPVDDTLLADAARIASAERIALYDAAFIALAARLDCELVTADRRQAETKACRVRVVGTVSGKRA